MCIRGFLIPENGDEADSQGLCFYGVYVWEEGTEKNKHTGKSNQLLINSLQRIRTKVG